METIKEVWSGILDYLHNLDDISGWPTMCGLPASSRAPSKTARWWCSFTPTSEENRQRALRGQAEGRV